MIISWHGFNYFKLKNNTHSLIVNPYGLDKVTKFPKTSADIILFSDPSQIDQAKFNKEAFVVDSAGEYEISDVFVYGREVKGNIIYFVVFEGIKIAFLGEFAHEDLSNGDLELIEGADILILPVGGGDLTTAKEASKIIQQVEPRIVIPSCYNPGSGKLKVDNIDVFVKEFGVKAEEEDKYKIKKKDLPQEDIKLIVLKLQK
ncbi:MAG: MBL fold metallo-hydrolase [Patescibacteria group bacterium]|jgi:L-ascorbate metabolism protein UlaG (beta-lactamase superfamily)